MANAAVSVRHPARIHFGAESLQDKLASAALERQKELETRLQQSMLLFGNQSFSGYELLEILKELNKDAYKPPTSVLGKVWGAVSGVATFGLLFDIRYDRIFVSHDKLNRHFFVESDGDRGVMYTAYRDLEKQGLVQESRSGFKLTPEGYKVLSKHQDLSKASVPVSTDILSKYTEITADSQVTETTPESTASADLSTNEITSTDPEALEKKQIMQNAAEVKSPETSTPLRQLNHRIAACRSKLREMVICLACLSGMGSLTGGGMMSLIVEEENKIAEIQRVNKTGAPDIQASSLAAAERSLLFYQLNLATLFLVSFLITGMLSSGILRERSQLRKDLAEAERLKKTLINVTPEEDGLNQRLVQFLKQRIASDSARFAEQFKTVYEQQPETRELMDQVFGSREKLPSAETIQNLFQYYTYQLNLNEQGASGWDSHRPVPEREFYEKMSALMRIGMDRGDLFEFVKANRDKAFGQSFNEELSDHVELLESRLNEEMLSIKTLLGRETEIEDHLKMARKALLRSSLSMTDRSGQTQEITKLIDAFKTYQEKIRQTLTQAITSQNPINMDALETDSLDEMILRLKTALEVEKFKDKLQETLDATDVAPSKIAEPKTSEQTSEQKAEDVLSQLKPSRAEKKNTNTSSYRIHLLNEYTS